MAKILIVFGTQHGQTRKIAQAIGQELRSGGHAVHELDCREAPDRYRPGDYALTLIGGPVIAGGYPRELKRWVKSNARALNQENTLFFSVCLGILQKDPAVRADLNRIADGFFSETGWKPKSWRPFAGALHYTRYGWVTKILMRRIARKAGGGTDVRRDYEYTDWDEVRDYARALATSLPGEPPTRKAHYKPFPETAAETAK